MSYRRTLRSEQLIRWAGLVVWAGTCLQLLAPLVVDAGPAPPVALALISVPLLGSFLWGVLWVMGPGLAGGRPRTLASVFVWLSIVGTLVSDLFQVVSIMLPLAYRPRTATIWFVVGTLVALVVYGIEQATADVTPTVATMVIAVIPAIAWRLLGFAIGFVAAADRQRRIDLARVNEQLLAAQQLLADRTRLEERLEISRELHDSIGHHLVALNVQLELARHQAEGRARETVIQAQDAGRRMLADVRTIVSEWRGALELRPALAALATEIDAPRIVVHVQEGLDVSDPLHAHALYRCAQEVVTNAVRHADAREVSLDVSATADELRLVGRDDGRGQPAVTLGNGLRGLQERARALGGQLTVTSTPGGGFLVEMCVPLAKDAAS